MGKDYIPLLLNGYNLMRAYFKIKASLNLKVSEISEADNINNFEFLPPLNSIIEIEAGSNNTNNTILRLENNGFCVINGFCFKDLNFN